MFEVATARRIVFGRGVARQVPGIARELGHKALVVVGRSGRGGAELCDGLDGVGVRSVLLLLGGEPTTSMVDSGSGLARDKGCDLVIAQGGGSVIDAGKAIAGMIRQSGPVLDYLEVVGGGKPLEGPGVPFVAVPTTAGTGAEVTRNAVLDVREHRVKVSLRSPHLLAAAAVVDPELTLSVPPDVTASTGMDALTQLIEPFVSRAANPMTDGICREGLARVGRSLERAYRDGSDVEAREEMALASLFGGLALANAKLGAVHGFAGVLGGLTGHAHGAICARLLPFVMEANLRAIEARGAAETRRRFAEVARILTGDPGADAVDGVTWVRGLCERMGIVPLGAAGLAREDFEPVLAQAKRASSMQGNPVALTDDELRGVLEAAL